VNAGTETIGISLAHQFQLGSLRILRKGRSSHESDLFLWKKLREQIAVAQVVEPGDGQHSRDFRSQSSPECFRLQATIMAEANPGQGNAKGTRLGGRELYGVIRGAKSRFLPSVGMTTIPTLAAKNTAGVGAPAFQALPASDPTASVHRTVTIQNLPMDNASTNPNWEGVLSCGKRLVLRRSALFELPITSEQRTAVELKNEDEVHIECCDKISHADRQPN